MKALKKCYVAVVHIDKIEQTESREIAKNGIWKHINLMNNIKNIYSNQIASG